MKRLKKTTVVHPHPRRIQRSASLDVENVPERSSGIARGTPRVLPGW